MVSRERQEPLATKLPCFNDGCTSSDAMFVYTDHAYCFSCSKYTKLNGDKYLKDNNHLTDIETERGKTMVTNEQTQPLLPKGISTPIKDRGLSLDTVERYGVGTLAKADGTILKHYYPYYDKDNKLTAYKTRTVEGKEFAWEGQSNKTTLFGQSLFPSGVGPAITIFEGELDAMSGYQMSGGFPAISVSTGAASAETQLRRNLEYLEGFSKIVLCFDNDEVGQEYVKKCAALFTPGKCRIMKLDDGMKDASDYLQQGKTKEFSRRWYDAETYAPEGILPSSTMVDRIKNRQKKESLPYPWKGLNDKTYGIRTGEIVLICARRGVGKTQFLRETTYGILQADPTAKVGTLYLEEQPEDSALGMMSIHSNMPMHLPDCEYTDEQFDTATQILSDDRMYFYDSFGVNDLSKILQRLRYYNKGLGCKYFIVDHLGVIASDHSQGDERKRLDDAITALRKLSLELDVTIFCTIHLNREGMVRGSDGPENWANIKIDLDRNVTAESEVERRTTVVTVSKNRFFGAGTGVAAYLYGETTGRLNEIDNPIGEAQEKGEIQSFLDEVGRQT